MKIIDFAAALIKKDEKLFMIRKTGKGSNYWSVPMLSLKREEQNQEEIAKPFISFLEDTFKLKIIDFEDDQIVEEKEGEFSSKFFFFSISGFEGTPQVFKGWECSWFDLKDLPHRLPVLDQVLNS